MPNVFQAIDILELERIQISCKKCGTATILPIGTLGQRSYFCNLCGDSFIDTQIKQLFKTFGNGIAGMQSNLRSGKNSDAESYEMEFILPITEKK